MSWIGIDLGGTTTKVVVVDDDDRVLGRASLPSDSARGPERWAQSLVEELESLTHGREIAAFGLSVAALIDDRRRIVQAPNLVSFEGADVTAGLRERWPGRPVVVENDVNAAIVGEHRRGAGRGTRHLCMLSLGTGVGGGIVLGGRLFRGAHGLAGELGHMILDHEGPMCTCGQRGHVESYLSTAAVVARAHEVLAALGDPSTPLAVAVAAGEDPEPRVLAACARQGCEVSRRVLADAGRWLGIACVNLAHVLQPEKIVIGGGVSQSGDLLLAPAREEFERRRMRAFDATVEIVQAELGVDGAAIGAAALARESLDASAS